jgi:hypothetical protein
MLKNRKGLKKQIKKQKLSGKWLGYNGNVFEIIDDNDNTCLVNTCLVNGNVFFYNMQRNNVKRMLKLAKIK